MAGLGMACVLDASTNYNRIDFLFISEEIKSETKQNPQI